VEEVWRNSAEITEMRPMGIIRATAGGISYEIEAPSPKRFLKINCGENVKN
jgi:hypothetical protein